MKISEILETLQGTHETTGIKINTVIEVGKHDAIAAYLLEVLFEVLDDTATKGDVDGIIDAMKWWSTFFHTMVPTTQLKEEDDQSQT